MERREQDRRQNRQRRRVEVIVSLMETNEIEGRGRCKTSLRHRQHLTEPVQQCPLHPAVESEP
jgi:hypothetical protein